MPTLNVDEAASKILELYRKRNKNHAPVRLEMRALVLTEIAICQRGLEMAVRDDCFNVKQFCAEFSKLLREFEESKGNAMSKRSGHNNK